MAYGSIECSCDQKIVSCDPADSFAVVARCDALGAEAGTEVLCAYNRTVGTRWTDETRGHMNVSSKVQAAIQVNGYSMELQIVTRSFGITQLFICLW